MTSFDTFVNALDREVRSHGDLRDRVLTVRAALKDALAQEQFVLDCIERVTVTIAEQRAAWRAPPIYSDPGLDYSVRMIYWPANYRNNPHEHRSWTVTGVVHNRFEVHIYRWQEEPDASGLVAERVVAGGPGDVGYILPPCIHSFANPTDSPSVSLHIFSGLSGDGDDATEGDATGQTIWYPSPRKGEIMRGMRRRALLAHAAILSRIDGEGALRLLEETFGLGDPSVKLESVKAMSAKNPMVAGVRLAELAEISEEPTRSNLFGLSERLLAAAARSR